MHKYFAVEFSNNATLNNLALELVEGDQNLSSAGQIFHLDMFSYKNHIVLETIYKHLEKTNFIGVSVSSTELAITI